MANKSRSRSTATGSSGSDRKPGFDRKIGYVFLALALLILLVIVARKYSDQPLKPTTTEVGVAPETLGGIPREGKGGDPDLNRTKNRIAEPSKFEEYTASGIMGLGHEMLDREGRQHRARWSSDATAYLDRMESLGARLTGYLIYAKESGNESCNGYLDSLHDYHIWIGDSPDAEKANAVIVEITPRWKVVHPEWRLRFLEKLSEQHARVRVTGWLMWDEEHADEVGKSRGTQWEVHPVTKFEVFTNGAWESLTLPSPAGRG